MLLVDIYVPSVDKTYNFSLNENVEIGSLITEITEMIEKNEKSEFSGDKNKLFLYDKNRKEALSLSNTLYDYYITTGSQLILV